MSCIHGTGRVSRLLSTKQAGGWGGYSSVVYSFHYETRVQSDEAVCTLPSSHNVILCPISWHPHHARAQTHRHKGAHTYTYMPVHPLLPLHNLQHYLSFSLPLFITHTQIMHARNASGSCTVSLMRCRNIYNYITCPSLSHPASPFASTNVRHPGFKNNIQCLCVNDPISVLSIKWKKNPN